jgi:hypothetical protein
LHKPREKEKGISERGKNNARMGRVKEKKKEGRNRNGEEADSARGNRNHSRRGRETNNETGKERSTRKRRSAK